MPAGAPEWPAANRVGRPQCQPEGLSAHLCSQPFLWLFSAGLRAVLWILLQVRSLSTPRPPAVLLTYRCFPVSEEAPANDGLPA